MSSEDLPFQYDAGRRSNYAARGQEIEVENINAYICYPSQKTKNAVIVVHDIYGWQFPDTRFVADIITDNGYITITPDFFLGKAPWTTANHWQNFGPWLKEREPTKVDKTAEVIMKYLRKQCNAEKIGIVGFSWGGMAVHHLMLKNPDFIAGVSLCGIIRNSKDRYDLLNPTFFIFGGKDHTISPEQVTLLEENLKKYCKVDYKVKVYPGQVHGFAQYKPEDIIRPENAPYIEEARMDMINWLNKYITF
uniref:Carboxymethylenebutenolidase homolog n=1 Tax=Salvator merianae TaxID=96440 RepID=A0A8D0C9Y4_SALMN